MGDTATAGLHLTTSTSPSLSRSAARASAATTSEGRSSPAATIGTPGTAVTSSRSLHSILGSGMMALHVNTDSETTMRIGIIGGTGKEGGGLAVRWARAGHTILIGSRDAARAPRPR